MFEIFAHTQFDWRRVYLFWVDERAVPPTDSQSNFKLAQDTWLGPGNFPPPNIHRVPSELEPAEAAARYAQTDFGDAGRRAAVSGAVHTRGR